jgi:V/A-type H+-transporting ATPase subunit I
MALGLSTGVIASVFNKLGALAGRTIAGGILFIAVFLIGQVFNLAMGALGAFVHSSRLTYVEYFGKFYSGGGREFTPLKFKNRYVSLSVEEENTKNQLK